MILDYSCLFYFAWPRVSRGSDGLYLSPLLLLLYSSHQPIGPQRYPVIYVVANPVRGHKEVPRSTGHIMATTRYSDQQGSKSRQNVMRLYKQWQRSITKRYIKPPLFHIESSLDRLGSDMSPATFDCLEPYFSGGVFFTFPVIACVLTFLGSFYFILFFTMYILSG